MNGVLNMLGFDYTRTYSDAPAAVVEAGLAYLYPTAMAFWVFSLKVLAVLPCRKG